MKLSELRQALIQAEIDLTLAYEKRDFESCGLIQAQMDAIKEQIGFFEEEEGYSAPVDFQPTEKPYREIPDGPQFF
jgi:hypothetical protein